MSAAYMQKAYCMPNNYYAQQEGYMVLLRTMPSAYEKDFIKIIATIFEEMTIQNAFNPLICTHMEPPHDTNTKYGGNLI
jgi:hypothetical protein